MAIIKCNECGEEISDSAPSCPHCGCVYKKNQEIKVTQDANVKSRRVIKAIIWLTHMYKIEDNQV